jgi:hypothetical protein
MGGRLPPLLELELEELDELDELDELELLPEDELELPELELALGGLLSDLPPPPLLQAQSPKIIEMSINKTRIEVPLGCF